MKLVTTSFFALLLTAACGEAPDGTDPLLAPPAEPPVGSVAGAIHENQGTGLLSTTLATMSVALSGRNAAGVPFSRVTVRKGYLEVERGGVTYSRDDSELIGAQLTGSGGAILTIQRACPHPRTPSGWKPPPGWTPPVGCAYPASWTVQPDEFEYEVLVTTPGSTEPLCDGNWNRALPMAGTFSADGLHSPSAAEFSFACNSGVAVKCANWGYKPWAGWDRHQACTRMGRADYCGDGVSHTFEGTPIDLYDPVPINSRTGGWDFEAGWLSGNRGALCLSKLRWQTLPPGGPCPAQLPDPRESDRGHYCEDYSLAQMVMLGAKVFNDSGYYERGLYNWRSGSDYYTTSEGYYGGSTDPSTPPAPGYVFARYEGVISRVYLTGTIPLVTWRDPSTGDTLTTSGAAPAGYTVRVNREGFVYPPGAPPPATAVPLRSYCRTGPRDCITTAGAPPGGYALFRDEGFLLAQP